MTSNQVYDGISRHIVEDTASQGSDLRVGAGTRAQTHLDSNDIFPSEGLIRDQIPPALRLDREQLQAGHVEDIARVLQEHNMDVRGEDLVGDGVVHLTFGVFEEVELDQLRRVEGLAGYRVWVLALLTRHKEKTCCPA